MAIKIETNLEQEIEKAKMLLDLYEKISNMQEAEDYLTTEDVAKILGCTVVSAREYMNRPDFPLIECGKGLKVNRLAFLMYNMQRRTK